MSSATLACDDLIFARFLSLLQTHCCHNATRNLQLNSTLVSPLLIAQLLASQASSPIVLGDCFRVKVIAQTMSDQNKGAAMRREAFISGNVRTVERCHCYCSCPSLRIYLLQIPDFDNLYLDMNGIIHCCSHPNDADAHFRITEEDIFKNIFQYIEILFNTIKPQKLFFMAVDGVAPRAKINQQRGRRFRAAKEAEAVEARARARGEEIPKEARFDSNCITPGTLFMSRLTEQLKYFVTWKISTNKLWQKCKIILSGPEVQSLVFLNHD